MFIYSLPIFFNDMGLLQPWELAFIVLTITCFCWLTAPEIESYEKYEKDELQAVGLGYLQMAWLGRLFLWQVFWPFFLFLNAALYGIDNLAKQGHFTVSSWDDVYFMLFTPIIFWTLCVWRNSINCSNRIWAGLARLLVLSVYFEYGLKLIIRIDFPRIFFDCNELLLDYAACF